MQGCLSDVDTKMLVGTYPRIKNDLAGAQHLIKMSSVMPFSFNAVDLFVVTINERPCTRSREVSRGLGHDAKTSKTANIVKDHCSPKNFTQKYQMNSVHAASTPINWPKDLQKYNICICKEGMYEIVFSSQQTKAKDFRKHCCNVLFPHAQQQPTKK